MDLIAVLNLAGILLMYCLRTSALADVGNNPGEVEGITSGIGGNIDYLKKYCVDICRAGLYDRNLLC